MNFEKTNWPEHILLKNHLLLTLRPAEPKDAQQVVNWLKVGTQILG
jgi:hypothetical protein